MSKPLVGPLRLEVRGHSARIGQALAELSPAPVTGARRGLQRKQPGQRRLSLWPGPTPAIASKLPV